MFYGIGDGGGSSSGSGARVWGIYWTVGPCKRMVMECCGDGKYNKRLQMIGEAFIELEKYILLNMLQLDCHLPQAAGWIDWLRLMRLLHSMMMCTSVVAM